jgi:ketosteroid isomerase-like protein
VSAEDLVVAKEFLDAFAEAAKTGRHDGIFPLLASDVHWLTPKRELVGIDEVNDQLSWVRPPDHLDVDFDEPRLADLGGGRIVSEVHEIYRVSETGEYAYARDRRIELTIRDGKIAQYEMQVVG